MNHPGDTKGGSWTMNILITGNMGYVGPGGVRLLRQSQPHATIVGLDAGYFAHCLTALRVLPEYRLDWQYFADVRRATVEVLEGTDALVHLAAISNDPMGLDDPDFRSSMLMRLNALNRLREQHLLNDDLHWGEKSIRGRFEDGEQAS